MPSHERHVRRSSLGASQSAVISMIPNGWFAAVAIALVAMLAGCGTATPYQPATDGQGYAEQALERDRYRVTFVGNSLTSRETVENYLLFRAAEVTMSKGFDHFVMVSCHRK